VQLRISIRQNLLVLVPSRLVITNAVLRDTKQKEAPAEDLIHRCLDRLLQVPLAASLDKCQRLPLSSLFTPGAVMEDQ
jgi:hypothetical protein